MKEKKAFSVVECGGTPYEIGKRYGTACRDDIVRSIDMHVAGFDNAYKAGKAQILSNAMKFHPAAQSFDPYLMEMLRGQADGAGVSFEEVFMLRCGLELGEYYRQITALCTSFAATGDATRDGETFIGQNIDWAPNFPLNLLKIRHADGPEQLTLAFGGVLEWTLSSRGFGICMNLILSPPEDQRLNVPCGCVIPKAMRQKTVGDALGTFCGNARGMLYYGLASGDGDMIGIESTPGDFNVLYPEGDILVHSNHYLTEKFKKGDWVHGLAPDSYLRVHRMRRLMEKHRGNLSPELMMELLCDENNYPNSICRHVDGDRPPEMQFETVASVIMVPRKKVMYVAYGTPCRVAFEEYRL